MIRPSALARRWNVATSWVYRQIELGSIPHTRFSSVIMIPTSFVEEREKQYVGGEASG